MSWQHTFVGPKEDVIAAVKAFKSYAGLPEAFEPFRAAIIAAVEPVTVPEGFIVLVETQGHLDTSGYNTAQFSTKLVQALPKS